MNQFHTLKVLSKTNETRDSVRIALDVPEELRPQYRFLAGQHLPIRALVGEQALRRTYSICSVPGHWPMEIGVRVQPGGAFSGFVANSLQAGDAIDVMSPLGHFHVQPDPAQRRFYVAFAAGSGITPILSIIATLLDTEPQSRVCLIYGNRKQATTMFIEDLYALKNRYPERLQLQFVFSQEEQEFDIAAGRIDAAKVRELWSCFLDHDRPDAAFICGPDSMIDTVTGSLVELGMAPGSVHSERFGAPVQKAPPRAESVGRDEAEITVIMDGHRKVFAMSEDDGNIVDAAAAHGIELPYSCKGGVCATCRCHLDEGEVQMAVNYGLEPWEVEAGFVLACQSSPVSRTLTLNYDKT